jgi:hypothetical protein
MCQAAGTNARASTVSPAFNCPSPAIKTNPVVLGHAEEIGTGGRRDATMPLLGRKGLDDLALRQVDARSRRQGHAVAGALDQRVVARARERLVSFRVEVWATGLAAPSICATSVDDGVGARHCEPSAGV